MSAEIDVLCIAGTGQNGATLLCRMLGQIPGFVAVGELGRLWDKGLVDNTQCGCGAAFHECPFWTQVGDRAFGGWEQVDGYEAIRLREALTLRDRRLQHPFALPMILYPKLSSAFAADLERYIDLMGRLYRGIHEAAGGGIIVDSMKIPAHVYTVTRIPGIKLRIAHLVRDPRGVAYSNTKRVKRQGTTGGGPFRATRPPRKTAIKWLWFNLSFHVLARRGVPMTSLRYEDLVSSPRQELERILVLVGADTRQADLPFVHGTEIELAPDHLAAGNRMRLQTGKLPLRADEAWRTQLDPGQRRLVETLTRPLRRRYGYR